MEMRPHHCSFKLWKPIEPSTKNFSTNHKLTGLLLSSSLRSAPLPHNLWLVVTATRSTGLPRLWWVGVLFPGKGWWQNVATMALQSLCPGRVRAGSSLRTWDLSVLTLVCPTAPSMEQGRPGDSQQVQPALLSVHGACSR